MGKRPHTSSATKVSVIEEALILRLRKERNLDARRIQSELKRLNTLSLSLATIYKVLERNAVKSVVSYRNSKEHKRYQCQLPGERIQMDTCKIKPGMYQYTAIDDCTRYRVLRIYSRRTAANTVDFIECVLEKMPFQSSDSRPIEVLSYSPTMYRTYFGNTASSFGPSNLVLLI